MTAPWFQCPHRVWPLVMESMPRPLDPDVAVADLRWWANEARLGGRFPSSRKLAERWGWTRWKVQQLLKRENPCDQPLSSQSPASDQPLSSQSPATKERGKVGNHGETSQSPASDQPLSSQSPAKDQHARVVSKNQEEEPTTNNPSSQLALTAAEVKPDPWMLLLEHLATYRPSAKTWDPKKNNGRSLSTLLKRHGLEDAKRIVTLAHTSADLAYLRQRRSDGAAKYPDVATMYRHGGTWLENCADAPSAITGERPSWAELCAWHDAGSPRGETRRFLNTLPGGWERWQAFTSPRMREKHARTYAQLGGQHG